MKRTKLIKMMVAMLAFVAIALVSVFGAFAADIEFPPYISLGANNEGRSFSDDWESYKSDEYGARITYGFNTFLINEDYCWAEHSQLFHFATIQNSNGWHDGPLKSKGNVSKIEVRHAGSFVYYACEW